MEVLEKWYKTVRALYSIIVARYNAPLLRRCQPPIVFRSAAANFEPPKFGVEAENHTDGIAVAYLRPILLQDPRCITSTFGLYKNALR